MMGLVDAGRRGSGRRLVAGVAGFFQARPWIGVLGLALAVRLPGLASRPLWYDEAFAVLFSSKGPAAMLRGTLAVEGGVAADVHPILYYTLLWLWGRLLGTSPLAVRSLSLLLGLGIVGLGFLLAHRLFGRRTAVAAGLLLALSPFQVHYAQETRMYALLALLLLGATLLFWRGLNDGGVWPWLGFGLLAAAAQYTHNLAFTYLLPLSLAPVFLRRWRALAWTGLAGLLALALYSPWMLRLPSQMARVGTAYWISAPGPAELVRTLLVFVCGLPVPAWALPVALTCGVLVLAAGGWAISRGLRSREPDAGRALWMAYLAAAPVAVMFLASQWRPVYLDRALLASGAAFTLWLAWVLTRGRLTRPVLWTGRGALVLATLVGLFGFYTYRGFPYAPYADLGAAIGDQRVPGEVILHSNKITALPAIYADPDLDQHYLADPPGSGSDTLARATQDVLGLWADPDVASAVGSATGVWFILFPQEIEDYRSLGLPGHPALTWLEEHFQAAGTQAFGELMVYHFVREEPG